MSEALLKLIRNLSLVGFGEERLKIEKLSEYQGRPNDREEYEVSVVDLPQGSTVTVLVTDFWRYPGIPCYFVNFSHTDGNFMACMGTPHIEQALFDLGACMHMIPPISED